MAGSNPRRQRTVHHENFKLVGKALQVVRNQEEPKERQPEELRERVDSPQNSTIHPTDEKTYPHVLESNKNDVAELGPGSNSVKLSNSGNWTPSKKKSPVAKHFDTPNQRPASILKHHQSGSMVVNRNLDQPSPKDYESSPSQISFKMSSKSSSSIAPRKKKNKWPTNKDIKKRAKNAPLPSKEQGFGNDPNDSDQLDETRHELADGFGRWMPARPDWDDRAPFVDALVDQHIAQWISTADTDAHPVKLEVGRDIMTGEIALPSWIPTDLEGMTAEKWWSEHLRHPGIDSGTKAWWERYISAESKYLEPHVSDVTDAKLDPEDNDMRKIHQTAETSRLAYINNKLRRTDYARRQRELELERILAREASICIPRSHPFAPRIDMNMRAAESKDMEQVVEIYNHYADNTVICPEIEPLSTPVMREKWTSVVDDKLPFLVVVENTDKTSKRQKKIQDKNHILAFAFANNYKDMSGIFCYAVELQIFVKKGYQRLGVGRCLMDKMISILDAFYRELGGYEFLNSDDCFGPGGARDVKSVIVNLLHTDDDNLKIKELREWLAKWKFEQVGNLAGIGEKFNQKVTQTILLRRNGRPSA